MDFDEIADAQGWNVHTMLMIVRDFVSQDGGTDRLNDFAREVADEENNA